MNKISVIGVTAGGLEYPVMNPDSRDGRRFFESMQEAAAFIVKYPQAEAERLGIIHWQFAFE